MEWQPIETAPMDVPVLVAWKWSGGDFDFCVAQKSSKFGWWVVHGASGYECENEFEDRELRYWMHIPGAPK